VDFLYWLFLLVKLVLSWRGIRQHGEKEKLLEGLGTNMEELETKLGLSPFQHTSFTPSF